MDSVSSLCRTTLLDTRRVSKNTASLCLLKRGPVAVINAAFLKNYEFVVSPQPWNFSFKETTVSSRSEWCSIVWSIRDRDVACSISQRQGSNSESCVWREVYYDLSHYPHKVRSINRPDHIFFSAWMRGVCFRHCFCHLQDICKKTVSVQWIRFSLCRLTPWTSAEFFISHPNNQWCSTPPAIR